MTALQGSGCLLPVGGVGIGVVVVQCLVMGVNVVVGNEVGGLGAFPDGGKGIDISMHSGNTKNSIKRKLTVVTHHPCSMGADEDHLIC